MKDTNCKGSKGLLQGGLRRSVHNFMLFIINEHCIISNMPRPARAAELDLYRPALDKWIPTATVARAAEPLVRFDGLLEARVGNRAVRYLIEEKRHFRHQDAAVIADQLGRRRAALPRGYAGYGILLLAPHVREQQAGALERAGIDYIDLAGNVHLNAPGLFVHVQGQRPQRERVAAPVRPQKGWVKTVLALLVRPELANAPYRVLADEADVALGTAAKCMTDLTLRGLLRGPQGTRALADRHALVALWVQAYVEALRPRLAERRFQIRATDKPEIWARLQMVMGKRGQPWALTGADAATQRHGYFRAEDTEIYAPTRLFDDREIQKALTAQPAVRGGNLLVIEPPGPLAIPKTQTGAVPTAPDVLAYAELRYRGTGQALEAAEMLLPGIVGDAKA